MGLSAEYQLLSLLVCAAPDEIVARDVSQLLAGTQINWQEFISKAEQNGVSPWLYHNRDNGRIRFAASVLKQLRALAVRHRYASEIYTKVLIELLALFEDKGIEVILLKGAALARTVYQEAGLRPMCDLDILVKSSDLDMAEVVCQKLGFRANGAARSQSKFITHHHLPTLEQNVDGLLVSLEIHQDAFARDTFRCLNMDKLTSKPQRFAISDRQQAAMFGSIDMLDHLTQHAFEPGSRFKLSQAIDLSQYMQHYRDSIPWPVIQGRYLQIINRLQSIHEVCPLPRIIPVPPIDYTVHASCSSGVLMPTLSDILHRGLGSGRMLCTLFRPPVWWLYGYYGRSRETPLLFLLLVVHPWRVGKWLVRRAWVKITSGVVSSKVAYENPA